MIDYRHVTVNQQELCILDGIDFHLDAGEFVYLIGKVGSGKTSLLKTFYAELEMQEGEAKVLGYDMRTIKRKHIPALRRKLGIDFQDFQLLIDRTVTENLDFVLRATGWKNKQARVNRINEVLDMVGMSTKASSSPVPSSTIPKSSWPMNQRETSTPRRADTSWSCCATSPHEVQPW